MINLRLPGFGNSPKAPPPPTPPPTMADPSIAEAARKERLSRKRRGGIKDTILTGGLGDTSDPSLDQKRLLGS
jgi:hypothetical protein